MSIVLSNKAAKLMTLCAAEGYEVLDDLVSASRPPMPYAVRYA